MKTHLDLFSGIGGFALAARWNNIQTVGFVEYEDYPRRVLSKQFPGVLLFGDIQDFDATPFRGVDLITGGYPCQPFSQAGKRKGKEDVRHLWPEMFRVITQARPSWVLAENVAGHINLGLDEVLADLESEGYATRTLVLPACAKNAPHRRDRVWIIAKSLDDTQSKRCEEQHLLRQRRSVSMRSSTAVADTSTERTQGLRTSGIEESHPHAGQEVPLCSYERIGSSYWETEPNVGRVVDGVSNRVDRLKGLGNAIVPQVAYEIIRCMKEIDESF